MRRKLLTKKEKAHRSEVNAFNNRVKTTFRNAKFTYLSVQGKTRQFGNKVGELDAVFLFENILLVCENTITQTSEKIKSHLRNKHDLFCEIDRNQNDLINWLKKDYPDQFSKFKEYGNSRYRVFFLYFTKNKFDPDNDTKALFKPVKIIEQSTLNYFHKLSKNIRFSSRYDIFRFLELKSNAIGYTDASSARRDINTAIVCPADTTGHDNSGVRLVSFMVSADFLIRNAYVLRKDNWENHMLLYQRLIEYGRIKKIREYVAAEEHPTFYNNIIVSLPEGITFSDSNNKSVKLEDIREFAGYTIQVPDAFNSICIIDGQHRIFAYHEGEDHAEDTIKLLREKMHLLVTGLIFSPTIGETARRKYESEIFLDINSNAKPVPQDVLLFIETLKDPFSDLGIARRVLEGLNQESAFHDLFELSLIEKAKIKTTSIIKFALRNLVAISDEHSDTLYAVWSKKTDISLIDSTDEKALEKYIEFIVQKLDQYFDALKFTYSQEWDRKESKILSIASINGFIIALRISLDHIGLQDYAYYEQAFRKLDMNFSKGDFLYVSSQYHKFATVILEKCFGISD